MVKHKRIIFVGPSASGKTFIRNKFSEKGYKADISYTSRPIRYNETDGVDYFFISKEEFERMSKNNEFYEQTSYNGNYYGTSTEQWNTCDVFVMETDGLKTIKPEDRDDCVIIYVDTPIEKRIERMRERGWDEDVIMKRTKTDILKFYGFKNYDVKIYS